MRQKGFSQIYLVVAFLAIVILGGVYYLSVNKSFVPTNIFSAPLTPIPSVEWKTYSNQYFTFNYPSNWQVEREMVGPIETGVNILGPEGSIYSRWGNGLGGGCEPEQREKIFAFGENQEVCHAIFGNGTEQWGIINKKLDNKTTLGTTVVVNDPSQQNREVVFKILDSFKFGNQPQAVDTSNWLTHRELDYGLTMKYPSTWKLNSDKGIFSIYEDTPDRSRIDLYKDFQGGFCEGSDYKESTFTIESNVKAKRIECSVEIAVNFNKNGEDLWLIATFVNDNNRETFHQIINSLKLTQ